MEMRKCPRGHYYDASTNSSCPYCNQMGQVDRTVAAPSMGAAVSAPASGAGRTVAFNQPAASVPVPAPAAEDEGRTVAVIRKSQGIDPVVGWLVCVSGRDRGQDYRIHTDNNYIGRGDGMDIRIKNDETISRENQAIISFDPIGKAFYCSPGTGRGIIHLNGQPVLQPVELHSRDRIVIGQTELMLIPLCDETFEWGAQ